MLKSSKSSKSSKSLNNQKKQLNTDIITVNLTGPSINFSIILKSQSKISDLKAAIAEKINSLNKTNTSNGTSRVIPSVPSKLHLFKIHTLTSEPLELPDMAPVIPDDFFLRTVEYRVLEEGALDEKWEKMNNEEKEAADIIIKRKGKSPSENSFEGRFFGENRFLGRGIWSKNKEEKNKDIIENKKEKENRKIVNVGKNGCVEIIEENECKSTKIKNGNKGIKMNGSKNIEIIENGNNDDFSNEIKKYINKKFNRFGNIPKISSINENKEDVIPSFRINTAKRSNLNIHKKVSDKKEKVLGNKRTLSKEEVVCIDDDSEENNEKCDKNNKNLNESTDKSFDKSLKPFTIKKTTKAIKKATINSLLPKKTDNQNAVSLSSEEYSYDSGSVEVVDNSEIEDIKSYSSIDVQTKIKVPESNVYLNKARINSVSKKGKDISKVLNEYLEYYINIHKIIENRNFPTRNDRYFLKNLLQELNKLLLCYDKKDAKLEQIFPGLFTKGKKIDLVIGLNGTLISQGQILEKDLEKLKGVENSDKDNDSSSNNKYNSYLDNIKNLDNSYSSVSAETPLYIMKTETKVSHYSRENAYMNLCRVRKGTKKFLQNLKKICNFNVYTLDFLIPTIKICSFVENFVGVKFSSIKASEKDVNYKSLGNMGLNNNNSLIFDCDPGMWEETKEGEYKEKQGKNQKMKKNGKKNIYSEDNKDNNNKNIPNLILSKIFIDREMTDLEIENEIGKSKPSNPIQEYADLYSQKCTPFFFNTIGNSWKEQKFISQDSLVFSDNKPLPFSYNTEENSSEEYQLKYIEKLVKYAYVFKRVFDIIPEDTLKLVRMQIFSEFYFYLLGYNDDNNNYDKKCCANKSKSITDIIRLCGGEILSPLNINEKLSSFNKKDIVCFVIDNEEFVSLGKERKKEVNEKIKECQKNLYSKVVLVNSKFILDSYFNFSLMDYKEYEYDPRKYEKQQKGNIIELK